MTDTTLKIVDDVLILQKQDLENMLKVINESEARSPEANNVFIKSTLNNGEWFVELDLPKEGE